MRAVCAFVLALCILLICPQAFAGYNAFPMPDGSWMVAPDFSPGSSADAGTATRRAINNGALMIRYSPGTHTFATVATIDRPTVKIDVQPSATLVPTHSGAVGLFLVTGNDVTITGGGTLASNALVNDQILVHFSGAKNPGLVGMKIQYSVSHLTSNPAVGVKFTDCVDQRALNNTVLPAAGLICFQSQGGIGLTWTGNTVHQNLNEINGVTFRNCYIPFDVNETAMGIISHNRVFNVGDVMQATMMPAVVRLKSLNGTTERGHFQLNGNQFEACVASNYYLVQGCEWVDIVAPYMGTAAGGINMEGNAGIKITSVDGTSGTDSSYRIGIYSGTIHNLARAYGTADALQTDPATALGGIEVTDADTITRTTGNFAAVMPVGSYIDTTGGGFNANNTGLWKVVGATANTIDVDTSYGSLTVQAAATRSIKGLTAYDGAAIDVEYCDGLTVNGISVTDVGYKFVVKVRPSTVRGVNFADMFIHTNNVNVLASMAPFRFLEEDLPESGAGHSSTGIEGMSLSGIRLMGWGTRIPISKGELKSGADVAPTIGGARFFSDGLSDAGTSPTYGPKVSGTTMANLSTWMRLDN